MRENAKSSLIRKLDSIRFLTYVKTNYFPITYEKLFIISLYFEQSERKIMKNDFCYVDVEIQLIFRTLMTYLSAGKITKVGSISRTLFKMF